MQSFRPPFRSIRLTLLLAASCFIAPNSPVWGLGKAVHITYNADAKLIADKLKPLGLTPKADPNGLKLVSAQIAAALTEMEKLAFKSGPGAQTLLKNAYDMFRTDMGVMHRNAAEGTVFQMWSEARDLGAFDDKHQFTGKITRGADAGKDVVFEYIAPVTLAPLFSKDVANIRLVAPSHARPAGAAPTFGEQTQQKALATIAQEEDSIKQMAEKTKVVPVNAAGETAAEVLKRWKAEMKAEGAVTDEVPSISIKGQLISMPTKLNGNCWHLESVLNNLSPHATEVDLETMVIGSTYKKRENYLMLDKKEKVQLRSGDQVTVPMITLAQNVYKARSDIYENLDKKEVVRSLPVYRGCIWRVTHGKDDVAVFATDPAMLDMLKVDSTRYVGNMVKMFLDPKEWAKEKAASAASANKGASK